MKLSERMNKQQEDRQPAWLTETIWEVQSLEADSQMLEDLIAIILDKGSVMFTIKDCGYGRTPREAIGEAIKEWKKC
jgi:hypothetical protein